jgi:ribosomal protein L11 methylase PrmA
MAKRALELLSFPDSSSRLILDLGCGSGISGNVLSNSGHNWIGMDISESMLQVAKRDLEDVEYEEDDEENEFCEEIINGADGKNISDIDDDDDENMLESKYISPGLTDLFVHDMGQGVCFKPGTFDGCIR